MNDTINDSIVIEKKNKVSFIEDGSRWLKMCDESEVAPKGDNT